MQLSRSTYGCIDTKKIGTCDQLLRIWKISSPFFVKSIANICYSHFIVFPWYYWTLRNRWAYKNDSIKQTPILFLFAVRTQTKSRYSPHFIHYSCETVVFDFPLYLCIKWKKEDCKHQLLYQDNRKCWLHELLFPLCSIPNDLPSSYANLLRNWPLKFQLPWFYIF